jgi:DNA-binding transcriptional LysR family regulator
MRYKLENIVALIEVVEAGSFSAAARRLNVAKSVVSKRIADLEDTLRVRLLNRSTRQVVPTERGAAFCERAKSLISQLDDAVGEASEADGELSGRIRIAAPMSFGNLHLTPILFGLLARHPRLEFAVDLDDRFVDLVGRGYDLGIRIGRLADSTLVGRKLADSRRVTVCSPAYAGQCGLPKTPDDLHDHACIGYANVSTTHVWQFRTPGGETLSVNVSGRFVGNNGEANRDAAVAGLGICVLPRFLLCDDLRAGALVEVLPDFAPVPDVIRAVYPRTRHLPSRVRALIDHLAKAFADPPWER